MARKKKAKPDKAEEKQSELETDQLESVEETKEEPAELEVKRFFAAKNFRTNGVLYTKGQELNASFEKFIQTGAVIQKVGT